MLMRGPTEPSLLSRTIVAVYPLLRAAVALSSTENDK